MILLIFVILPSAGETIIFFSSGTVLIGSRKNTRQKTRKEKLLHCSAIEAKDILAAYEAGGTCGKCTIKLR